MNKSNWLPPNFPHLNENHLRNSKCCHAQNPIQNPRFPTDGKVEMNTMYLINSWPYVHDNTHLRYGTRIHTADMVFTRITQRRDPTSINLNAKFDMTSTNHTNSVWQHFLLETIKHHFHQLNGLMPVMKSDILFRLHYDILDTGGGVIDTGVANTTIKDGFFHGTDIKDYFIASTNGLFVVDIPNINFMGPYTFRCKCLQAFGHVINTEDHVQQHLNRFYQWVNNNTAIAIQHREIDHQTHDAQILLAELPLDQSFSFAGNLTTRMRMSFTAFWSTMIAAHPNTFEIWKALFDSCGVGMAHMREDITNLRTDVDDTMERVDNLEIVTEDHEERISILEQRPSFRIDTLIATPIFNPTRTAISAIHFEWTYANGKPIAQRLNKIKLDMDLREFTMEDLNITETTTFELRASNGYINTRKSVTVEILSDNIIFYGSVSHNDPEEFTNADIFENDRINAAELSPRRFLKIVQVTGNDDFFFFAAPMERPIVSLTEHGLNSPQMRFYKRIDDFPVEFPNGDVVLYQILLGPSMQNTLGELQAYILRFPISHGHKLSGEPEPTYEEELKREEEEVLYNDEGNNPDGSNED